MGKPEFKAGLMATAICLLLVGRLFADDPTTQSDPDAVRLTFLGDRLTSVEASIKAIDHALIVAGYKQSVAAGQANTYQQGNDLMNRNGGGPVDWQDFYGRTARSFIVRDTKTAVAVGAGPNGVGVAAVTAQGAVRQIPRPREFDFVYKANNDAIAQAQMEVARLGKTADVLIARRRQLEAEQSMLWATIAFESIENREIPLRPLYHYQLAVMPSPTNDNRPDGARLAAERAMVLYLRTVDHAVFDLADGLETDQRSAYRSLRDTLQKAQADMQVAAAAFGDTPGIDAGDISQVNGIVSLAKRIGALCKNTCDSYDLALDGDKQGDEQRKETFRGQLQESLMAFAETTAQVDDALVSLASAWEIHGQVGKANTERMPDVTAPQVTAPDVTAPESSPPAAAPVAHGPDPKTFDEFTNRLNGQITNWTIVHGSFILTPDGKLEGGEGDSQVTFKHSLPADLNLSLQVNVISGSHPTIYLGGPSLIIGDFLGNKTMAVKSNQVLVPGSFAYQDGQDIPISIRIHSGLFTIVIGDQTISGPCVKADHITLGLRAGLKGNSKVDFSEFVLSPPDGQNTDAPAPEAPSQVQALTAAGADDLSGRLNSLDNWRIVDGEWTTTPEGKFESGDGYSTMLFKDNLPGEMNLSFHMTVLSGKSPLVMLEGAGVTIGDLGDASKMISVAGIRAITYENGQDIPVFIRISGGKFVARVGDKTISGNAKKADAVKLLVRAGRGGQNSKVDYWQFKVDPITSGPDDGSGG